MRDESWTVAELLEALKRCDRELPGDVLARFEPWFRHLLRFRIGMQLQRKFDPSDIVQQAMLEAYRDLPNFRGTTDGELAAWLRVILQRVFGHEVRRWCEDRRDVYREVDLARVIEESAHSFDRMTGRSMPTPSGEAMGLERQLILAELLEGLPDDYREVITLRRRESLSYEEIARHMGRSSDAVRMLFMSALEELGRRMKKKHRESSLY